MILWFWLFVLGWITYILLQRSIARQGRTPLWLLWLVLMMPALVWATWTIIFGSSVSPPLWLMLGPFICCPFLYWLLLRNGLSGVAKARSVSRPDFSPTAEEVLLQKVNSLKAAEADLPRPLSKEEEADLRHCFPWNLFALHQVEYRLQAVICQGQLRADPSEAYRHIQTNINDRFGDRFLVLLQENWTGKPFFALVPNVQAQQAQARTADTPSVFSPIPKTIVPTPHADHTTFYRPVLALGLLLITLFTTTFVGTIFAGVPLESLADLSDRPELLWQGLPYGICLTLILGFHESGHFLAARHYRIATTLPYFIPIPTFLGTFGAFIQIKSPIPHRRALFDVSFAGPAAGLIFALPCLWWGIAHSEVLTLTEESGLMNFQSLNPWGSVLIALISRLTLGARLTADTALNLHPVAIAGYLGLIVTALNLMPVGQLDGGHIIHAMFGQRTGAIVGHMTRLFMLLLSIRQPEFLLWGLLLLFIPVVDEPALNDVSELDDVRDFLGFLAIGFLLLIILPLPQMLQNLILS